MASMDSDDNLSSYFQKSAAVVRHYADLIEQDYAQPILRHASLKFRQRPVAMTFLSIFTGLALLPVLSFVGFTVFALTSIVFFAFISAVFAFITVELVLVACLVFVLWSLLVVASFTTAAVVFVYWTTRLGVLVSYGGPSGVVDWTRETQQYFLRDTKEATDDSDGPAVLVDGEGPSSKKIKVEEETPPDS